MGVGGPTSAERQLRHGVLHWAWLLFCKKNPSYDKAGKGQETFFRLFLGGV